MDLIEFFQENNIIVKDGFFQFKDIRKGTQRNPQKLPAHSPRIIKDIKKIFTLFRENKISVSSVSKPVLVAIIQERLGYTRTWSYTIAGCIDYLLEFHKSNKIPAEIVHELNADSSSNNQKTSHKTAFSE